jgi:hypothetical protein
LAGKLPDDPQFSKTRHILVVDENQMRKRMPASARRIDLYRGFDRVQRQSRGTIPVRVTVDIDTLTVGTAHQIRDHGGWQECVAARSGLVGIRLAPNVAGRSPCIPHR